MTVGARYPNHPDLCHNKIDHLVSELTPVLINFWYSSAFSISSWSFLYLLLFSCEKIFSFTYQRFSLSFSLFFLSRVSFSYLFFPFFSVSKSGRTYWPLQLLFFFYYFFSHLFASLTSKNLLLFFSFNHITETPVFYSFILTFYSVFILQTFILFLLNTFSIFHSL